MSLRDIFCTLLFVYWLVLFARIILSWFPISPSGPFRVLVNLIYDITDPPLRLVRGILPPIRMGAMGIDLSPLIIFVIIAVLQRSIC